MCHDFQMMLTNERSQYMYFVVEFIELTSINFKTPIKGIFTIFLKYACLHAKLQWKVRLTKFYRPTTRSGLATEALITHLPVLCMSIHVLCQVELYSEGDMLGLSQTSLFLFHGHTESLHDVGPCSQTLVEAVHEYHATVGQLWGVVLGHHPGIHAA